MGELLAGSTWGRAAPRACSPTPDGTVVATAVARGTRCRCRRPRLGRDGRRDGLVGRRRRRLRRAARRRPTARAIAGVCVSGIGPCLLAADADGRPLRPAILYGIDMRATAEIAELTAALRRRGDPRALRHAALDARRSARSSRGCAATSRRSGSARGSWYMAQLVRRRTADRRVRARPPLGQPVRPALRPARAGDWADDWADEIAPGLELPRARLAGRHRRARSRAAAAARPACAAGTPVDRGHDRRLGRGAQRRRPRARRPDADVRLDDVLRRRCSSSRDRSPALWTTRRRRSRHVHPRRGHGDVGRADRAGCSELTGGAPFERARRRGGRDAARRRRAGGAAVLRRRADADRRPATRAA